MKSLNKTKLDYIYCEDTVVCAKSGQRARMLIFAFVVSKYMYMPFCKFCCGFSVFVSFNDCFCIREPTLRLTLMVDMERWLSYKGTCHVILLADRHIFHINYCLKSVSKVALLHRFHCCVFIFFVLTCLRSLTSVLVREESCSRR